jgi:hypothetical protein
MTRTEALNRLQVIMSKGSEALLLLESQPLTADRQSEIRELTRWIQSELREEYTRMLPAKAQKALSIFELSVYSATIEETWKKSGISRIKVEESVDQHWKDPLEGMIYHAGKYLQ